jgi:hypothetical protein
MERAAKHLAVVRLFAQRLLSRQARQRISLRAQLVERHAVLDHVLEFVGLSLELSRRLDMGELLLVKFDAFKLQPLGRHWILAEFRLQ